MIDAGVHPVLTPWSGTLYHGTSEAQARAIIAPPGQIHMPDVSEQRHWDRLMVGPAVYGFCGEPCWGCVDAERTAEQHGIEAALGYARYRTQQGTLRGPLAVVAFEVKLERVLDLESAANRIFCDAAAEALVALGREWDWNTDDLSLLRESALIGKVLNAGLDELPTALAPEACRLHLPFADSQQQAALAIFKESSMLHARLAGWKAALQPVLTAS